MLTVLAAVVVSQLSIAAGRLPEGYQETTYVRFTGKEYIDTLFTPNTFDRIEISFMPKETSYMTFLACRVKDASKWLQVSRQANAKNLEVRYGYNTAVKTDTDGVPLKDTRVTLVVDGKTSKMYVGLGDEPELVEQGKPLSDHTENDFGRTMMIGAGLSTDYTTPNNPADAIVYSVRVYGKDGVRKADFVPCYTSEKCGFYDVVNNRFCGELSMPGETAAMEHGPDVVQPLWMTVDKARSQADFEIDPSADKTRSLYLATGNTAFDTTNGWANLKRVATVNPGATTVSDVALSAEFGAENRVLRGFIGEKTFTDDYEELSFVGANKVQWVNTGFTPYSTDRFEIKFNLRENAYHTLLCCRGADNTEWFNVARNENSNKLTIRCGTSDAIYTDDDSVTVKKDFTFVADCKTKKLYIDGVEQQNTLKAHELKDFGCPMMVFAGLSKNGEGAVPNNFAHAYIYYIKVYGEDGKLKADFVPYRDVNKDRCGFYNRMSGAFCEEILASGATYTAMDRGEVIGESIFKPSNMEYFTVDFAVQKVLKEAGVITGANLVFTGSNEARKLWVAWAKQDQGANLANWTNKQEMSVVPCGDACFTVENLPAEVSDAVSKDGYGWRFFLSGPDGFDRTEFSHPRKGLILVVK